jgi:4-hydroxy-tetrahydrodipicolinate reductase
MGARVARAIEDSPDLSLVARPARGALDGDWCGAKVLADFTAPDVTARLAELAQARGVGLLIGTTGLDPAGHRALEDAGSRIAVLVAPNLSPGVAALTRALRVALPAMPGADVEIVERHHRGKADSPSGTALALARVAAEARGVSYPEALKHGRSGRPGPRGSGEIGVHAVRGGGIVGQHNVLLAGVHEVLELSHVALDRECFAEGALIAVRFLARARPGVYALEDALA